MEAQRHQKTREELNKLYRSIEGYILDLTLEEYTENKPHFIAVLTLIHQQALRRH